MAFAEQAVTLLRCFVGAAAALAQDCANADRALAQLRAEHQATVLELEIARDDLVSAARAAAGDTRSEGLVKQLREQHDDTVAKLTAAREDMMDHQQAHEEMRAELRDMVRALETTEQALGSCQREQEQLRAEHRETAGELEATRRELLAREQAEQRLRTQHADTVADLQAAQHDLVISRQETDDADTHRAAALRELGALRQNCQENAHVAEGLQGQLRALRDAVEQAKRELAAGEREADALHREHWVRLPAEMACLSTGHATCKWPRHRAGLRMAVTTTHWTFDGLLLPRLVPYMRWCVMQ